MRTIREVLGLFLGSRHRWSTLLVLGAAILMVRLGFWQLDRLEQRRARNARILTQMNAPPLNLNTDPLPDDLAAFRYRRIVARGHFDFKHQVALKNRTGRQGVGVDLVTPLVLEGKDTAVLVDRGWIPYDRSRPEDWKAFDFPEGTVVITGFVGLAAMPPPNMRRPILPDEQRSLFYIDPPSLADLMPYSLLPFYVVWMPAEGEEANSLPMKYAPQYDLSEGPHLGYAIQWFLFAALVPIAYFAMVMRQGASPPGE